VLFWQHGKKVETLVNRHLSLVDAALRTFEQAMAAYLHQDPELGVLAQQVHEHESKADDVRREVISELLHGALLGSYREDMLHLVEQIDRLANGADALVSVLVLQQVQLPEALKDNAGKICTKTILILDELHKAIGALFANMRGVLAHTGKIEKIEGEIDKLEQNSIRDVFQMDLPLAEKIWVRDFISRLAQLSDRAEDLSDLIEVIVAKRRV